MTTTKSVFGVMVFYGMILSSNTYAKSQKFDCDTGQTLVKEFSTDGMKTWCEVAGVKEGPYQLTNEKGQVLREGQYSNGEMDQEWRRYYSNGKLKDKGAWVNNAPNGYWKFYRENGKIKEEGYYENGTPVCSHKHYSKKGKWSVIEKEKPKNSSCEEYLADNILNYKRPLISLLRFSVDGLLAIQSSGGKTMTGMLGYQPQGRLNDRFDWVAGLGVGVFKSRSSAFSLIPVFDLSLGARYYFKKPKILFTELRIGLQTWMHSGTYFAPSIKIGIDPHWRKLLCYIGYQPAFLNGNLTNEFRLGVEFGFDSFSRGKK